MKNTITQVLIDREAFNKKHPYATINRFGHIVGLTGNRTSKNTQHKPNSRVRKFRLTKTMEIVKTLNSRLKQI